MLDTMVKNYFIQLYKNKTKHYDKLKRNNSG